MTAPAARLSERPTLAELVKRSDLIVVGQVRRRLATLRGPNGGLYSRWVVLIFDRLNRRAETYPASEILVDHPGGRLGLIRYRVAGDPGLSAARGRRPDMVVLFLKESGDNVFTIVDDPAGHLVLRDHRVFSVSALTGSPVPDLGVAGVPEEDFLALVRQATGVQRQGSRGR